MHHTLAHQFARFLRAVAHRSWFGTVTRLTARATVDVVDDPTRPIRLVRVAGVIDSISIDSVLDTWRHLTAPHLVHVDVQDAVIRDAATMTRLSAHRREDRGDRPPSSGDRHLSPATL